MTGPLQNRVRPDGLITNHSWRGTFMGNRGGRIHDPSSKTLTNRKWASKRWIICVTEFKNREREVMGNGYTELFFLDEVAALAAGHRPCFECRRAAANSFANHWERAVGALVASRADEMDAVLHDERIEPPRTVQGEELDRLPEGAFIESGDKFYAKRNNLFWLWSGNGYSAPGAMITDASLITPPSILKVLTSGYEPVWHVSIG